VARRSKTAHPARLIFAPLASELFRLAYDVQPLMAFLSISNGMINKKPAECRMRHANLETEQLRN